MTQINEIDRRVLAALSGADRIKALLGEKGLGLREFAEKYNLWVENVSRCIHGQRPVPEARDALALELGLTREQVDQLIDEGAGQ